MLVSFSIQATSINNVTRILSQIESGDPSAAEKLLPLVYEELRRLAAARMADERSDHTLQPTALVHEAYVRLVDQEQAQRWNSRGHFYMAAAEAMKRILIEQARRKRSRKLGGDWKRVDASNLDHAALSNEPDLIALNEALQILAIEEPIVCDIVKLRYFAGLTLEQAAEVLGISLRTANRNWAYAKAWLYQQLSP